MHENMLNMRERSVCEYESVCHLTAPEVLQVTIIASLKPASACVLLQRVLDFCPNSCRAGNSDAGEIFG